MIRLGNLVQSSSKGKERDDGKPDAPIKIVACGYFEWDPFAADAALFLCFPIHDFVSSLVSSFQGYHCTIWNINC